MFKGPPEISPFGGILRKQDAVSHFIQCESDESVRKRKKKITACSSKMQSPQHKLPIIITFIVNKP